jgi:orotidine-5'-phosphate decarboxylase
MDSPVILALDGSDIEEIGELIQSTRESISIFKIGLEFFNLHGIAGVKRLQEEHGPFRLFLDLKLHDIPNTVYGGARAVSQINPEFLTVHASGGSEMISAAVRALPETKITAVTLLTSLSEVDLQAMGNTSSIKASVCKLAEIARRGGARALVASPEEAPFLRENFGSEMTIITPGVRLPDGEMNDQKRVMTPKEAIESGAHFVVIGRPITRAKVPARAAQDILLSIRK